MLNNMGFLNAFSTIFHTRAKEKVKNSLLENPEYLALEFFINHVLMNMSKETRQDFVDCIEETVKRYLQII